MEVGATLVADGEAAEAVEPGQGALNDPPMSAQFLAGVDALPRNADADMALGQGAAAAGDVIGLVGMALVWPLAAPTRRGLDGRNGVPHGLEDDRGVAVSPRQECREWLATSFDHNMALRARFAAIRRVGTDDVAPLLAGMLAESSEARLQSIRSASPSRSNNVRCRASHTPASCQSRRRRQQVTPEPQPISWGNISHGMPVLSTKMMPLRAARSERRGRPPLGLGGSDGSSGATKAQSSSLTRSFIAQVYHAITRF
jgi:hypothetical protein